jgi:hypothetical protein
MTALLEAAKSVVKGLWHQRAKLVEQWEALANPDAEDAALAKDEAQADAEIRAQQEPHERKARIQAARVSLNARRERQQTELESQLRDPATWPRALRDHHNRLNGLFKRVRRSSPPQKLTKVNPISDQEVVTNADAIAKHVTVGDVVHRQRIEVAHALWHLRDDRLAARLAELGSELDQAIAGTMFEHEDEDESL